MVNSCALRGWRLLKAWPLSGSVGIASRFGFSIYTCALTHFTRPLHKPPRVESPTGRCRSNPVAPSLPPSLRPSLRPPAHPPTRLPAHPKFKCKRGKRYPIHIYPFIISGSRGPGGTFPSNLLELASLVCHARGMWPRFGEVLLVI